MALSFTIAGPPRTKKNHGKVIQRGARKLHVSSDAYQEWNASAQMQLARVRAQYKGFLAPSGRKMLPWDFAVNVAALFYRHADVGDAVGFYQALADTLQEGRILVNDKQIVSWDGSRMLKDATNPRVEVTITLALE